MEAYFSYILKSHRLLENVLNEQVVTPKLYCPISVFILCNIEHNSYGVTEFVRREKSA